MKFSLEHGEEGLSNNNKNTYTCFPENPYSKDLKREYFSVDAFSGFCIDDYDTFLENKYEEVKRGDVINVRTTFSKTFEMRAEFNTRNTYSITFLIELDPL